MAGRYVHGTLLPNLAILFHFINFFQPLTNNSLFAGLMSQLLILPKLTLLIDCIALWIYISIAIDKLPAWTNF